jgi:superfamily II DNA helicase RecQ
MEMQIHLIIGGVMQCKVFSVPAGGERAFDSERKLNDFLGATNVKRIFASLASQPEGPMWSVLFFYEDGAPVPQKAAVTPAQPPASGVTLTGEQGRWIIALKKWRSDQAATEGVPLYMVSQNKWLEDMVRMPARTVDDLKKITGFGEWRVQKYGAKIVEILNAANAARNSRPTSSYSAGTA